MTDPTQADTLPCDENQDFPVTLRATLRHADWLAHIDRWPENPFADELEGFPLTDEQGMAH